MHVRFTQIKERVTADSLLGKAVSCDVSVVKADRIQGGSTTNCVRREVFPRVYNRKSVQLPYGFYTPPPPPPSGWDAVGNQQ